MSQPPHGEDPQDPRAPGWGPPAAPQGQDGGWGPPSGTPYQGGWGQQQGQYGGYGQPGQYGGSAGQPGQYGGSAGQPGQYGGSYGQPYGAPGPYGQPGQYGAQPGQGQPQYGQYDPYGQYGGWEQPPPPPRRKRRFGVLFMLLVLALLIGLAFTLPARLSSTRLDPDSVQRDVAAQFEQREGVAIDVQCDEEMTVETGTSYECQGTTAEDDAMTITITITSDDGDYTWAEG